MSPYVELVGVGSGLVKFTSELVERKGLLMTGIIMWGQPMHLPLSASRDSLRIEGSLFLRHSAKDCGGREMHEAQSVNVSREVRNKEINGTLGLIPRRLPGGGAI